MAPKPQPKSKSSFISILAACTAIFALAMVGAPMAYDHIKMRNPTRAKLTLNLSPSACRDMLHDEQASADPCEIEVPYAFDPVSKEMVLFLQSEDVRIPNWETAVASVDGKAPTRSLLKLVSN